MGGRIRTVLDRRYSPNFWCRLYGVLDYLGADEDVRTQALIILATITLVNAIWRATGALAARIELMSKTKHD